MASHSSLPAATACPTFIVVCTRLTIAVVAVCTAGSPSRCGLGLLPSPAVEKLGASVVENSKQRLIPRACDTKAWHAEATRQVKGMARRGKGLQLIEDVVTGEGERWERGSWRQDGKSVGGESNLRNFQTP
jgi:hypothetical protein